MRVISKFCYRFKNKIKNNDDSAYFWPKKNVIIGILCMKENICRKKGEYAESWDKINQTNSKKNILASVWYGMTLCEFLILLQYYEAKQIGIVSNLI